jgi:hypothetical protein
MSRLGPALIFFGALAVFQERKKTGRITDLGYKNQLQTTAPNKKNS